MPVRAVIFHYQLATIHPFYDGRNDPPYLKQWIEYFVHVMALNASGIYDVALATREDAVAHAGCASTIEHLRKFAVQR